MSIFPKDDLLSKEIDSWKSFRHSLRKEDKILFENMLRDCNRYIKAIQVKGEPYSTQSLLLSLVISQHKMIEFILKAKANR